MAMAACLLATRVEAGRPSILFERDTVLSCAIEVPRNKTCVIKPGVTIRFSGYHRISVEGLLIAEGRPGQEILITGTDRARGSTAKPCWQGIEVRGKQADAVLRHCRIEGAYRNFIWGAKPIIDSCSFVGNHYAIYCSNRAAPSIRSCTIYRNRFGVVADFASPLLLDNVITENVVGIYTQLSSGLVAGRNFVEANKTNVRSDKSMGENHDALSLKYIWDLMRQLH